VNTNSSHSRSLFQATVRHPPFPSSSFKFTLSSSSIPLSMCAQTQTSRPQSAPNPPSKKVKPKTIPLILISGYSTRLRSTGGPIKHLLCHPVDGRQLYHHSLQLLCKAPPSAEEVCVSIRDRGQVSEKFRELAGELLARIGGKLRMVEVQGHV
jgi:hypothetical protein